MRSYLVPLIVLPLASGSAFAGEAPSDRHCALFSSVKERLSPRAGRAVDPITRFAGVEVLCAQKHIVFRQDVNLKSEDLEPHWTERRGRYWSATYCRGTRDYREAIRAGWTIATVLTLSDGREIRITADCSDGVA